MLGELAIRAWLSTVLAPDVAARAAAGWAGDRAGIYAAAATVTVHPDGGVPIILPPPLAWLTVWDDAGEADDFAHAAEAVAGATNVKRRNEAVAVFLGPPELSPAALEPMLDGWKTVKADVRRHARSGASSHCVRGGR